MSDVPQPTAEARPLTIALTSYNYARYITEAIDSVVNQTCPNWRLRIFDNKSTDSTVELIKPYLSDNRITLVSRDRNIGQRNNLLQAFEDIDTEYVCTLQADDFLDASFVQTALDILSVHSDTPFVIFNWHHYLEHKKRLDANDSSPFAPNRAGPLLLGPYLSVANFVPLHMAVFRTSLLSDALARFSTSPITQLMEQFVLTLIEDRHGPGYFTGTYGGVWRRHKAQLTGEHLGSFVSAIEEPIERLWYATHAPAAKPLNVFMALVTFIRYSSGVDFPTAVDWLLDRGASFTESFGLCLKNERLRFRRAALAVALKFSVYSAIPLLDRKQLEKWLDTTTNGAEESSLRKTLDKTRTIEGDLFLNQREIDEIARFYFVTPSTSGLMAYCRKYLKRIARR